MKTSIALMLGAALIGFPAAAQMAPPSAPSKPMSQAEQTLVVALQGMAASEALVRSAAQAFAVEKDARIKELESELADLKKQAPAAEQK